MWWMLVYIVVNVGLFLFYRKTKNDLEKNKVLIIEQILLGIICVIAIFVNIYIVVYAHLNGVPISLISRSSFLNVFFIGNMFMILITSFMFWKVSIRNDIRKLYMSILYLIVMINSFSVLYFQTGYLAWFSIF